MPPSARIILPSEQDFKLLLSTTFDEGEGNPQSQGRKEPSGDSAVVLPPKFSKIAPAKKWLQGSPSVRPSSKAID